MPQSSSVTSSPSSVWSGASVSRWITGGAPPSAVANVVGSTAISPSWRFQYVHIGRSFTTSPDGVRMSMRMGSSSIAQNRFAHGPGAITTCSPTSIRPRLVDTDTTEPSEPSSSPSTSTPERIATPSDSHLPTNPRTESMLNAKPPCFSCRQTVTPRARQSGKSDRMCRPTSSAPTISSER